MAILTGVRQYLSVFFICVSVMIKDVGALFMLVICISSLEKPLFKSFAHF